MNTEYLEIAQEASKDGNIRIYSEEELKQWKEKFIEAGEPFQDGNYTVQYRPYELWLVMEHHDVQNEGESITVNLRLPNYSNFAHNTVQKTEYVTLYTNGTFYKNGIKGTYKLRYAEKHWKTILQLLEDFSLHLRDNVGKKPVSQLKKEVNNLLENPSLWG